MEQNWKAAQGKEELTKMNLTAQQHIMVELQQAVSEEQIEEALYGPPPSLVLEFALNQECSYNPCMLSLFCGSSCSSSPPPLPPPPPPPLSPPPSPPPSSPRLPHHLSGMIASPFPLPDNEQNTPPHNYITT
jgi:hypothetical protein